MIGISWNKSTPAGVEVELWDSAPLVDTPPEPELKTAVKEEAADIALKKKPVEKEPPKKEAVKETPKPVKPIPPKEKEKEKPKPVEKAKPVETPKKSEAPKKTEAASPN